jgi:hypothetical protein
MRARSITASDVRRVLEQQAPTHPTKRPRGVFGRDISGRRIKVVYVQPERGVFRVITAVVVD